MIQLQCSIAITFTIASYSASCDCVNPDIFNTSLLKTPSLPTRVRLGLGLRSHIICLLYTRNEIFFKNYYSTGSIIVLISFKWLIIIYNCDAFSLQSRKLYFNHLFNFCKF